VKRSVQSSHKLSGQRLPALLAYPRRAARRPHAMLFRSISLTTPSYFLAPIRAPRRDRARRWRASGLEGTVGGPRSSVLPGSLAGVPSIDGAWRARRARMAVSGRSSIVVGRHGDGTSATRYALVTVRRRGFGGETQSMWRDGRKAVGSSVSVANRTGDCAQ
jgi:hypothetical protein